MLSLSQQRMKNDYETRAQEEKKVNDRNRNLIILIERFLLNLGYVDALSKLQDESTVSLDKWYVMLSREENKSLLLKGRC